MNVGFVRYRMVEAPGFSPMNSGSIELGISPIQLQGRRETVLLTTELQWVVITL